MRSLPLATLLATLLMTAGTAALAQSPAPAPLATRQAPLPPLVNPPGDIPDSQAFVAYRSPLGFTLKAPEGWARREQQDGVGFADKYGSVTVQLTPAAAAPSVSSAREIQVAALEALPSAVTVSKVATAVMPGGTAVTIAYASNSEPSQVTGKAIRLENEQVLFWRAGKLATMTLSAPYGADNVDQWNLMARSFAWM